MTNIVQAVKKCYKRKIDSRDLRGRFLCFLLHPTPPYSPFKASLYCKWSTLECKRSTVAMQMEYSWSAKGLHFKRKGGILRDEISLASTKNRIIH